MDGSQTPLATIIAPANEHEVRHIERLVDSAVVDLPAQSHLIFYEGLLIVNCKGLEFGSIAWFPFFYPSIGPKP